MRAAGRLGAGQIGGLDRLLSDSASRVGGISVGLRLVGVRVSGMQLFQYIAIRTRASPELAALSPAQTRTIAGVLGKLRTAVDELDEDDVERSAPHLALRGPGWRIVEELAEAVDGDGELPDTEELATMIESLEPAAILFLAELAGYAGYDDEGGYRGQPFVELLKSVTDEAGFDEAVARGRRAHYPPFAFEDLASSAPSFFPARDRFPGGPAGDLAMRSACVDSLGAKGFVFPSTRPGAGNTAKMLLAWFWDHDETLYLFELPLESLTRDDRADIELVRSTVFASPADMEPPRWEAIHRTMARLGGDHMPVGGAALECRGRWSSFLSGSISAELGLRDTLDPGVLNHPIASALWVRRLA